MKPADKEKRQNAYALYLTGGMTMAKIAKVVGLKSDTLRTWVRDEGWKADRESLAIEEMDDIKAKLRSLIKDVRIETALRHIDLTKELEQGILASLKHRREEGVSIAPGALRDYAIAMKTSSEMSSKIAGLTESVIASAAGDALPEGPSVNVNVGFNVTPGALPVAAKTQGQIKDITQDVIAMPLGTSTATGVTRTKQVAEPCPF